LPRRCIGVSLVIASSVVIVRTPILVMVDTGAVHRRPAEPTAGKLSQPTSGRESDGQSEIGDRVDGASGATRRSDRRSDLVRTNAHR
jgi:hypothetical protein